MHWRLAGVQIPGQPKSAFKRNQRNRLEDGVEPLRFIKGGAGMHASSFQQTEAFAISQREREGYMTCIQSYRKKLYSATAASIA